MFLEIPQNSQENTCARVSFFNEVTGLRPANLLKKRLWHRYFPVNVAKFLRNPFYRTTLCDCFRVILIKVSWFAVSVNPFWNCFGRWGVNEMVLWFWNIDSLHANLTNWSNTPKQFADKLFECADHFVRLALKGIRLLLHAWLLMPFPWILWISK